MAQRTEPATGGPWQPPPAPMHKRLYRRTDDKMIGGVASGLADYFNIDPVLVRIGFVLLAVAGGAGVLAYLVMWWIVPPSQEVSNPGENAIRRLKGAPTWVAVALLVIGGLLLVNQLGPRHSDIVWGLGLLALGGLLFWHSSQKTDDPGQTMPLVPAPPPPPAAAAGWSTPAAGGDPGSATTASFSSLGTSAPPAAPPSGGLPPVRDVPPAGGFREPSAPYREPTVPYVQAPARTTAPAPAPQPRPKRERSGLGLATFGAAFLAVGIAALLDNWGAFDLSLSQYLALGLLVLSIGLLIGAWFGHAKWLAIPAFFLVPFVLVASLVTVPFQGGFGQRTVTPVSLLAGQGTYRLVAGELQVDLTQGNLAAPESASPALVTASVVAGTLRVLVPAGMPVHIHASIGAGAMNVLGRYDDGLKIERTVGSSPENARMNLELAVSFGRIIVARAIGQ
ncbi:MAG TPA: PspC domain-containing protein [Actinomycetota bacterium]|nr:PspC domain-containing protein [Actinomycetota bacterium]